VESTVQRLMDAIDSAGAPPMAKTDWKELLERIISECESRLEAVTEEIDDE
jgi:hypothetical protein